jgi:hypothetical protein
VHVRCVSFYSTAWRGQRIPIPCYLEDSRKWSRIPHFVYPSPSVALLCCSLIIHILGTASTAIWEKTPLVEIPHRKTRVFRRDFSSPFDYFHIDHKTTSSTNQVPRHHHEIQDNDVSAMVTFPVNTYVFLLSWQTNMFAFRDLCSNNY